MWEHVLFIFRELYMPLYEKLIQFWRDLIMKKFLLVTFILGVLAINLYGIINELVVEETEDMTITVYME